MYVECMVRCPKLDSAKIEYKWKTKKCLQKELMKGVLMFDKTFQADSIQRSSNLPNDETE
jgi:hypothetical protein